MNIAIELHDSECLAVESGEGGQGFVLLDANLRAQVECSACDLRSTQWWLMVK